MALRLSTGIRTALCGALGLDSVLSGGLLELYTGSQPASADYAETGTKLVRITLASSTYTTGTAGLVLGTAAAGLLPKSADVWSGVVITGGVAGYFRFYGTGGTTGTSTSERRVDGNVGVSGSDLVLANTTLVAGATLTIDTFTLGVPAS